MTKIYSADYIFPVSSDPVRNGAVAVNEKGEIVEVYEENDVQLLSGPIEKH